MTDEPSPKINGQDDDLILWAEVEASLSLDHPLVVTSPGAGAELSWEEVEQDLERVVIRVCPSCQGTTRVEATADPRLTISKGSSSKTTRDSPNNSCIQGKIR